MSKRLLAKMAPKLIKDVNGGDKPHQHFAAA
jgi:hypothetical protein